MAQRYPLEHVAGGMVAIWGVVLMCAAACTNFQGLYAQRFFLGFLESGIAPIWMLVVGGCKSYYFRPQFSHARIESLRSVLLKLMTCLWKIYTNSFGRVQKARAGFPDGHLVLFYRYANTYQSHFLTSEDKAKHIPK